MTMEQYREIVEYSNDWGEVQDWCRAMLMHDFVIDAFAIELTPRDEAIDGKRYSYMMVAHAFCNEESEAINDANHGNMKLRKCYRWKDE